MQRPNSNSRSRESRSRLVLIDGVLDRLLRQVVLQLEGGDRQAIDEDPKIEGTPRLIPAVAQLARHAEAVEREAVGGRLVAGGRRCRSRDRSLVHRA